MQAAEHKVRLKDLVRQLMPLTPLTGDVGQADLAVLEQWADPRALLQLGKARLTAVIAKASRNRQGSARAEVWLAAAEPRSNSTQGTRQCPSLTWPPRSPPR
jgi:hypothetical protein